MACVTTGAGSVPPSDYPTRSKFAALNWLPISVEEGYRGAVADRLDSDRTGRENGPDRVDAERVLAVHDTL